MKSTRVLGALALVTLTGTIALGLTLAPTKEQGVYSRFIAIHPGLAWTAYLAFGVTAVASALYLLRGRKPRFDAVAEASAEIGVVFTVLTLATGSIWGRPTWGVWWTWDARLTTTALMLVIYLGYLAQRNTVDSGPGRANRSAYLALLSVVVVPINHFAVEWWRTLHQGRALASLSPGKNVGWDYAVAPYLGMIAFTLTYVWLLSLRMRLAERHAALETTDLNAALEARRREGVST